MTETGEKEANIMRMPNANAILIGNKAVSDMPWIQEYLRDYLPEDGENCYFSDNIIGIFVRSGNKVEELLLLARDAIKNLGYHKIDVIPEYRALYIYDNADINIKRIEESLIAIESDSGFPVFYKPVSTYNELIMGLIGGKMSSSDGNSAIFLADSTDDVESKIKNAQTGGRETIARQKEEESEPTKCTIYELLLFQSPVRRICKRDIHRMCLGRTHGGFTGHDKEGWPIMVVEFSVWCGVEHWVWTKMLIFYNEDRLK